MVLKLNLVELMKCMFHKFVAAAGLTIFGHQHEAR